jgi:hypothetical protein
MLEIILLIALCRNLGNKLRAKARTPWPFQLMLVLAWFGGELVGAVVGVVISGDEGGCLLYLFALMGAAVGAAMVSILVHYLPALETVPSDPETVELFD